ncbi:hypothetical protein DYBT9275_04686 [Dyadobacter sp. CECT 9275]|uniref:histidine kinase n=1 Tax=Dyadobacter helix TaxID=2822344 RepID=A0A916JJD4_9BACT|nr:TIR domain-containing protein [Dyadobacter sp. CECT 9275]CAG5010299.1 hypothetical protein DYBT9275_04686 [Dyadobacter sp. CECT 9275]
MKPPPLKIFVSYSKNDDQILSLLITYLNPLVTNQTLEIWYDRHVNGGDVWHETIEKELNAAQIIIFILSPDLLNSAYINQYEITPSFARFRKNECRIVPIVARECTISGSVFDGLQCIPRGMEPLTSSQKSFDEQFRQVTVELEKTIKIEQKRNISLLEEEVLWQTARKKNSARGYKAYLRKSLLKYHIDDAIRNVQMTEKRDYAFELELLREKSSILQNDIKFLKQEIHDNIGGSLAALNWYLYGINFNDATKEEINNLIKNFHESIKALYVEVRNLSMEKPVIINMLDSDFNILESIDEIKNQLRFSHIDFTFLVTGEEHVRRQDISKFVIRSIQNLVINVERHSGAKKCTVTITGKKNLVQLRVADNGTSGEINNKNGFGINSLIQRTHALGGEIDIRSQLGQGSEVFITIPFKSKALQSLWDNITSRSVKILSKIFKDYTY